MNRAHRDAVCYLLLALVTLPPATYGFLSDWG